MNCTTPHCKGEVTKYIQLKICDKCYKKKFRAARRVRYDRDFKSLPRRQARGASGGVSAICWNKYCGKKFRAAAWQDPKYSVCPTCRRRASEIGVGLEWVERQTSLRRMG